MSSMFDISALDALFAQLPGSQGPRGGTGALQSGGGSFARRSATRGGTVVTLLDLKRASNVEIMLSKLVGSATMEEVVASVAGLDASFLTADQVSSMLRFLPTSDEFKILERYVKGPPPGDVQVLGKAERYFLALAAVDRVESKLWALDFKLAFDKNAIEVASHTAIISSACAEVASSGRLQRLLALVLAVGNTLNAGRAPALGFRVDSLAKLADTRSFDGRTTLLHYLVSHCERRDKDLLQVDQDLPHLGPAARRTFAALDDDLAPLLRGLDALRGEIQASKGEDAAAAGSNEDSRAGKQAGDATEEIGGPILMPPDGYAAKLQAFYDEATLQVKAMQEALAEAKAQFVRTVEWFGEDGAALDPAKVGASEPERFFGKLHSFLQALRKAKDDRLRVEHCHTQGDAPASGASPKTPADAPRPPALKMRSAPAPQRGETEVVESTDAMMMSHTPL